MADGKFIVFEGIDGVGKSTQAYLLIEHLKKEGIDVSPYCHDPTTSNVLVEAFKHIKAGTQFPPMAAAILFTAAHIDIYQRFVAPRLTSGRWVVMDRFIGSTLVYQAPALPSGFVELYFRILRLAGIRFPDVTIILDRASPYYWDQTTDPYASPTVFAPDQLREQCWKDLGGHRSGFANLVKWFEGEWIEVGTQTKDQVHQEIWNRVANRFLKGEQPNG